MAKRKKQLEAVITVNMSFSPNLPKINEPTFIDIKEY